jgi:hypothetical protein
MKTVHFIIQIAEIECDHSQIALLMNRVEYKKQKNRGALLIKCCLIYAFFFN